MKNLKELRKQRAQKIRDAFFQALSQGATKVEANAPESDNPFDCQITAAAMTIPLEAIPLEVRAMCVINAACRGRKATNYRERSLIRSEKMVYEIEPPKESAVQLIKRALACKNLVNQKDFEPIEKPIKPPWRFR